MAERRADWRRAIPWKSGISVMTERYCSLQLWKPSLRYLCSPFPSTVDQHIDVLVVYWLALKVEALQKCTATNRFDKPPGALNAMTFAMR